MTRIASNDGMIIVRLHNGTIDRHPFTNEDGSTNAVTTNPDKSLAVGSDTTTVKTYPAGTWATSNTSYPRSITGSPWRRK